MIIVKLKGGLGNQMFQYAFGKKLSIERNTNLKLDKTFLENSVWQRLTGITARSYELENFNITTGFSGFWESLFTNIFNRSSYFNDYWQSEKYFKDIRNVLINDFKLKHKSRYFLKIAKKISRPNSVSIHFRRGDYAENIKTKKYHGLIGLDYYEKAIKLISKKIKNPRLFIFSDDMEWVKKNFKYDKTITYVSRLFKLKNTEELMLMSKCKHNIIANSSFSWWGAWLNKNPNKIVIAPKKWFRAKVNDKDIVPESWVRI